MARIPTPLTWKRRDFAVLEPCGMVDRRYAVAVSGVVAGPFAIYKSPHSMGFTILHLPTQAQIIELALQKVCREAAERFAALDLNWWTSNPEEVIGPDLQEMRNLYFRMKGGESWVTVLPPWLKEERGSATRA
jgi:hypothetical protein